MAQGRWKLNSSSIAAEAYAVLIAGRKHSRTYPKHDLVRRLSSESVYVDFLKICAEYDDTPNLADFRKGLLLIVQAMGIGEVAKKTRISRMSLYRMLSKNGNPRLDSLLRLYRLLGIKFYVVDKAFVSRREQFTRPRDQRFGYGYRAKVELGKKQDAALTMSQVESKKLDVDD